MGEIEHDRSIASLVREASYDKQTSRRRIAARKAQNLTPFHAFVAGAEYEADYQSSAGVTLREAGWEDVDVETTVPQDEDHPVVVVEPEPVDAVQQTPMMRTQPTELEHIPIDDEDYEPTHADELGRAMRLLFRDLPDEVVSWMWGKVKTLRDKVDKSMEDQDQVREEARLRRMIRRALIAEARPKDEPGDPWARNTEAGVYRDEPTPEELTAIEAGDDDWESKWEKQWGDTSKVPTAVMALSDEDADMLAALAKQVDQDEMDPADRAAEEEEQKKSRKYVTAGEEGMSLKDLAKQFGFSGASGVKNLLYKIEDKMQYFASLDEVWFKRMMEAFAKAYVEELKDAVGENLDPAEVVFLDELMDEPDTVMRLPEFRMWAADYLKTIHAKKRGKKAED